IYKLIGNTAGAHNYYLDLVFQRGLIGFTIFISIFVYILFKLRKNIQTTTCIILGFICAYFLMFLSEPFYSVEKFHIPLIYCLAILVKRKKNNTYANSNFRRPAGPHFPASQGHIKRSALEIGRARG